MSRPIVVGGGIAGLTAAAYLARAGYEPLLLEKEPQVGGLIGTFERDGFKYDWGIRATENSGILFPMLKQLGIEIEYVKNRVSLGIMDKIIEVETEDSLKDYQDLLTYIYPENSEEIETIIQQIKKSMDYMEVQYDIDNPAFLDPKEDLGYMLRKVIPWAIRYVFTVPKINKLNVPIIPYLERYTENRELIDIIAQHFFKENPAHFALSYLKIYLDYYYSIGGTGRLPQELSKYITQNGGEIKTETRIKTVDPVERILLDSFGQRYGYSQLVWAADLNKLYNSINTENIDTPLKQAITTRKQELTDKTGNDSIFTLYIASSLDPSYFSEKNTGHFFYTPSKHGETKAGNPPSILDKTATQKWLSQLAELTTYEISIPALRDPAMAPPGKTGLIISMLFDYHLTKQIQEQGWYDEFRKYLSTQIIEVLDGSVYPGLKKSVIHRFTFTPLSIEERTGNTHGAITGWAYTNNPMPAEYRLPKIFSSTETPIPRIAQAGQWTYSPSGLPISILTGKLAADRSISTLKRARKNWI